MSGATASTPSPAVNTISIDEHHGPGQSLRLQTGRSTGGEPLAQKEAFKLIERLCEEGYEVLIETGDYVSTEGLDPRAKVILDIKCPASGEEPRNDWSNLERLRSDKDEVKFVIADEGDWNYAKRIIKEHDLEARAKAILISPAWGQVICKSWLTGSPAAE